MSGVSHVFDPIFIQLCLRYLFTSINRVNIAVVITVFGFIPGRDLTSVGYIYILLMLTQRYTVFIQTWG